jgi:hypothetical protein
VKNLFSNPGGLLKKLRTIGILFGCITAAFIAADDYWKQHNPDQKAPETNE